jgi:5'-nucleotidase
MLALLMGVAVSGRIVAERPSHLIARGNASESAARQPCGAFPRALAAARRYSRRDPPMNARIADLAQARILVTNDDGVTAKGVRLLERIAKTLTDDVWVVAPAEEQSGASHSLTLRRPLRRRRLAERVFSVDGTPTDCVMMGVTSILADRRPDLVLSGINRGANLGEDVTYSGTCAGAREGTLLGIPSIALSLVVGANQPAKWDTPERFGADLIRRLVAQGWSANMLINVNFPDAPPEAVKGIAVTALARRKLGVQWVERKDPRGAPYFWIGPQREEEVAPGTDLHAVNHGRIAVTPVQLELTHQPTIDALRPGLE